MKSLTGSALKLSLVKYNDKHMRSCFWCTPKDAFLGCAYKHFNVSFSLSVASQRELTSPVFSASALSSASSDTQIQLQDEDIKIPDENQSKTVHVKFQLQRECLFGQHFFIVGDDPIFGLWDPSQAIPMNWSEGHVWTVELDVPIGKLIKYKFILKRGEDTVLWQPGEDRVLQTWETMKTITIVEDWHNSEVQKIIEGEPIAKIIEGEPIAEPSREYAVYSELLMVADNSTQSSGNLKEEVNKELRNASSCSISIAKPSLENLVPTIPEKTTQQRGELEVPAAKNETEPKKNEVGGVNASESNGREPNGKNFLLLDNKTNLVCDKEFPVLVPGLTPMLTLQTEEPSANAVEKNAVDCVSLESDKAEELNVSELKLKEEPATGTSDPQHTAELMFNGQQDLHEDQQHLEKPLLAEQEDRLEKPLSAEREDLPVTQPSEDNNVLEGDIKWGQRTLQKFLMNFGLL